MRRRQPPCIPPAPGTIVDAATARTLILSKQAPEHLQVSGHLDLSKQGALTTLPAHLTVASLDLSGCTGLITLPVGLQVRRLKLDDCVGLRELPSGLRCYDLSLRNTLIEHVPADLEVANRLDLSGCYRLATLPTGFTTGTLLLRECTMLEALPEGLTVHFLDLSGCTGLHTWPDNASVCIGRLIVRGCTRLRSLPVWLTEVAQLDISGCTLLAELPPTLHVRSWLDLADTAITTLPPQLIQVQLRWRGVPITPRIAFEPETLTATEVLAESNAELRRVMLARIGYTAFLAGAEAITLDEDHDPGGERRLLKVPLADDEDIVCVAVYCPSTGRQYLLRVPPTMQTCRAAVAWIAGFDNPNAYRPLVET